MKTNVVYLHVKQGTSSVFYVGIGNTKRRAYSTAGRSECWSKIVSEFGYDVKIVNTDLDRDSANSIEKELIHTFGRKVDGGQLVNKSPGGTYGNLGNIGYSHKSHKRHGPMSSEHKRLISESVKENCPRNFGSSNGMSKRCIDHNGVEFPSFAEAYEFHGITKNQGRYKITKKEWIYA